MSGLRSHARRLEDGVWRLQLLIRDQMVAVGVVRSRGSRAAGGVARGQVPSGCVAGGIRSAHCGGCNVILAMLRKGQTYNPAHTARTVVANAA